MVSKRSIVKPACRVGGVNNLANGGYQTMTSNFRTSLLRLLLLLLLLLLHFHHHIRTNTRRREIAVHLPSVLPLARDRKPIRSPGLVIPLLLFMIQDHGKYLRSFCCLLPASYVTLKRFTCAETKLRNKNMRDGILAALLGHTNIQIQQKQRNVTLNDRVSWSERET